MCSRLLLVLVGALLTGHVMAAQQMLVNGEIKNFLDTDVRLQYPSWYTGDYDQENLIVESDGHVGFSFSEHPQRGQFDFALSGGEGDDKVACLYEVKYGERTYVKGPLKLTGPHAWTEAISAGKKPAMCSMRLDSWDYEKSMTLRFLIQ